MLAILVNLVILAILDFPVNLINGKIGRSSQTCLFYLEYIPKYVFGVNSFHNVLHTDDEKLRLLKFKPMIYMFILFVLGLTIMDGLDGCRALGDASPCPPYKP